MTLLWPCGLECSCSADGSLSQVCDPVTGQCPCRAHFHGLSCELCSRGYWKPSLSGQCQPCNCDPTRSYGDACDQVGLLLVHNCLLHQLLMGKNFFKFSSQTFIFRVTQGVFIKGGIIMTTIQQRVNVNLTQSNPHHYSPHTFKM